MLKIGGGGVCVFYFYFYKRIGGVKFKCEWVFGYFLNKGKEFVKKRKFIYFLFFLKLTWLFFGHLSVDVATKNSDFI